MYFNENIASSYVGSAIRAHFPLEKITKHVNTWLYFQEDFLLPACVQKL